MTKQEYQAKLHQANITANINDAMSIMQDYIESLEAENVALMAKNVKLEKAVDKAIEIFADEGAIGCPSLRLRKCVCNDGNGCNKLDSCDTSACWREYLGGENGKD